MDDEADRRTSAVCAALEHRWRDLDSEGLARLLLAARDRHRVHVLLGECVDTQPGPWEELCPVAGEDVRVAPLLDHARIHAWFEMPLPSLVQELLRVLDQWWFRWQWRLGDDAASGAG